MRILIVEDEKRLAEALKEILRAQKYDCDITHDGEEGLYYAQSGQYDAILLDVMLPGLSGLDIAKRLRAEKSAVPILMLTARDDVRDKVAGLDCGADDYMTKPFSPEELLARLRALLRRPSEVVFETVTWRDLSLNASTYALACGERSIRLSHREYEIMRLLMLGKSTITQKDDLILRVWGAEGAEDNNVEAYISFLRKKLTYLRSETVIATLRRVGYRLEEAAS